MKGLRLRARDGIAIAELGSVALTAPFLLFPTFRPALTIVAGIVLAVVWLARWLVCRRPGTPTALDLPLLLLALMVPVAVWASPFPELTLPKVTGLILGLAAFRAMVNAMRTRRHLLIGVILFLVLGLALVSVGLVSTAWYSKWAFLQPVLERIPRLIGGLPGAETGTHPNELAGVLLLFLPVSLAAVWMNQSSQPWLRWVVHLATVLLVLFFCAVLTITQSRSAWLGAVAGGALVVSVRWRPARWALLIGALVLAYGLVTIGPREALASLFPSTASEGIDSLASSVSLEGRLELWSLALYGIQDFPFSGCGLGAFRKVVHLFYPLFLRSPDADIAHAHNMFLQVALDLGLPGLTAYLALAGTALWIGLRLALASPGRSGYKGNPDRWLALGIAGSLVAFHVYGLTDAVALGAKPGVAYWLLLALAAGLWNVAARGGQDQTGSPKPSGAPDP
ncbi:MAG: O-antigen ligase family protein [Anaerolineae bacterium]